MLPLSSSTPGPFPYGTVPRGQHTQQHETKGMKSGPCTFLKQQQVPQQQQQHGRRTQQKQQPRNPCTITKNAMKSAKEKTPCRGREEEEKEEEGKSEPGSREGVASRKRRRRSDRNADAVPTETPTP